MKNEYLRESVALLGTKRFGTFWFASLLSNIGTWAQQMAQPWLLLSLGASPFLLGLDAFALGAPTLMLILVGGALADRADRRRTILFFQSIQMLCPLTLVWLLIAGEVEPWIVIALSLVVGVTDALSLPSFQSIVPSIVEREQIPSGIALNSTQFNLSRILGPALAGVLMASVGMVGAFAVSAASYVPFILVALWILPRKLPTSDTDTDTNQNNIPGLWASVGQVVSDPSLRGALLTVLVTALLCAPVITFSPLLVKEVFHGGSDQFSMALGALGIGGLIGAIGLMAVDPKSDQRFISTHFAIGFGLIVCLTAFNPWEWGLPALMVMAGVAMTASNASANALIQSNAPERIRGQSVSLFMLAMRGGMALGSLLTGLMVHLVDVQVALLINGVIALCAHLLIRQIWLKAI
jgi:MFS family permease